MTRLEPKMKRLEPKMTRLGPPVKRLLLLLAPLLVAARPIASNPDLGKAEGQCRANEPGPALIVTVNGLKDRRGWLRAELYPANDADFLADDNLLVMAGKTFRRVEVATPQSGPVQLCIRIPGPGTYGMSLLHDRNMDRKFNLTSDGTGFPGNPKLHRRQPTIEETHVTAGPGLTPVPITLNYLHGFLRFGPLKDR